MASFDDDLPSLSDIVKSISAEHIDNLDHPPRPTASKSRLVMIRKETVTKNT